jgi:hypothetical protein
MVELYGQPSRFPRQRSAGNEPRAKSEERTWLLGEHLEIDGFVGLHPQHQLVGGQVLVEVKEALELGRLELDADL